MFKEINHRRILKMQYVFLIYQYNDNYFNYKFIFKTNIKIKFN